MPQVSEALLGPRTISAANPTQGFVNNASDITIVPLDQLEPGDNRFIHCNGFLLG